MSLLKGEDCVVEDFQKGSPSESQNTVSRGRIFGAVLAALFFPKVLFGSKPVSKTPVSFRGLHQDAVSRPGMVRASANQAAAIQKGPIDQGQEER